MNWEKQKLKTNFIKIRKVILDIKKSYTLRNINKEIFNQFDTKFPKLFSFSELNCLYKKPINAITIDLFFCKICGNVVNFDHEDYSFFCNHCYTSFIKEHSKKVSKVRNTLTKEYMDSILPTIKKYIEKINEKVHSIRIPLSTYYDFNLKFPYLFTRAELNYLRGLPLSQISSDLFFCRNCGKPIHFTGWAYRDFCDEHCKKSFKTNLFSRVEKRRSTLTKEYMNSILPQIKSFIKSNKKVSGSRLPISLYYSFNSKFPYLLTPYELSYLRKLPLVKITPDLFFCKICNKPALFDNSNCCFLLCCSEDCARKLQDITNNKRYGGNPMKDSCVKEKLKKSVKDKYGVDNYFKLEQFKQKISANRNTINAKVLDTKRKNGTFNTSQPEEYIYKLLCKSFGKSQVKRQHRSDLYPFNCDFYIPKFDLYIEYNGSWTHGQEPYNSRKKSHKELLKEWKNKNKDYYFLAINVWTVKDPLKRKIAKKNSLRYIEFWNLDQVQHWLDKYGKAKCFSKGML